MKKSLRLAATLLLAIPVLAAAASTDTVAHRTAHAQHAATHPRAHAHRHAAPKRAHHAESARHHEAGAARHHATHVALGGAPGTPAHRTHP